MDLHRTSSFHFIPNYDANVSQIEGILTCVLGFGSYLILVDFPEKSPKSWNFLNESELTGRVAALLAPGQALFRTLHAEVEAWFQVRSHSARAERAWLDRGLDHDQADLNCAGTSRCSLAPEEAGQSSLREDFCPPRSCRNPHEATRSNLVKHIS